MFRSLFKARMTELVDVPDLGSGAARREGSSPSPGTILQCHDDIVFRRFDSLLRASTNFSWLLAPCFFVIPLLL